MRFVEFGNILTLDPRKISRVSCPNKHRFVNCVPARQRVRYVLLQIGEFGLHFVTEDQSRGGGLAAPTPAPAETVYIKDRKDDILALASAFEGNTLDVLTEEELLDVVGTLRLFAADGVPREHPAAAVQAVP